MKRNGFTLIEMIFCLSIILLILLLVIPSVTSKNSIVRDKGCQAQVEVINAQIVLYEIENGELPDSIEDLIDENDTYITRKQSLCPNGKAIEISEGKAYVE